MQPRSAHQGTSTPRQSRRGRGNGSTLSESRRGSPAGVGALRRDYPDRAIVSASWPLRVSSSLGEDVASPEAPRPLAEA